MQLRTFQIKQSALLKTVLDQTNGLGLFKLWKDIVKIKLSFYKLSKTNTKAKIQKK